MKNLFFYTAFAFIMVLIGCQNKEEKSNLPEEGDFLNQITEKEILDARLTPELLWKFGRVADMQLSPDGKLV